MALVWAAFFRVYADFYSKTKPFPVFGATPELFLHLNAGERFARCGFFRTGLLPDYSVSADCAERPILYTHMPSVEGVVLGILRRFGVDLPRLRWTFAFLTFAGLALFVGFCAEVTGSSLAGAAAGIYAIASVEGFLLFSDHCSHSFFWVSYFGSMMLFVRADSGLMGLAGRAVFMLLGLACNILYAVQILAGQLLLAAIERDRRRWRMFGQSLLLSGAFAALLLARNGAVLGWSVALKDVGYTVSNRIWAVPPRSELAGFYRSHCLVLWGAEKWDSGHLREWLGEFRMHYAPVILLLAFFAASRFPRAGLRSPPMRMLAAVAAIFSWYLIFMAHGQNYVLHYLARTAGAMVFAGVLGEIIAWRRALSAALPGTPGRLVSAGAAVYAVILFGMTFYETAVFVKGPIDVESLTRDAPVLAGLEALRGVPAESTLWSNMDSPGLRRYSAATLVGSCTEEAFRRRDFDRCYGAYFDPESETARRARAPTHFFISTAILPGNLTCDHKCRLRLVKELGRENRLLAGGERWWLYELRPASRRASRREAPYTAHPKRRMAKTAARSQKAVK